MSEQISVSGSILVTAGILLLAVISVGLGFYITYHLFHFPTIASIAANVFRAVTGTVQGTAAACDIAITIALICYLHSGRVTERMIDKLIVYAVCRGILTAIAQIMFLALNVSLPHRTLWQPFHQAVGKLYVNSVVASLNVRNTVRGAGVLQKSGGNLKSWSMPTMRTSGSTGRPNEIGTAEDYEAHDDDDKHRGFPRFATGPIEPCHLKPV
ncbi:hypothetical protein B0H13DRAFT_2652700 [Mycena leptocephala]|nr:hypothetical protein B0H13DRAFT_2652700 [Mycena leptocephala]